MATPVTPPGLFIPKKIMPNIALAGILAGFVAGSYFFSMHAVGQQDIEKEVQREVERQQKAAEEQAAT